MYPKDVQHIKTSNDIIQSIVTPFVEQHLEKEDRSVDELIPQCRNLREELEFFNDSDSRPPYVTKDPYYTSNLILKEMYT